MTISRAENERLYKLADEWRIRQFSISPDVLVQMCKQGNHINITCIEGLPEDAGLWNAAYSERRNVFVLEVVSATFDPVVPLVSGEYPEITTVFRGEHRP